MPQVKLLVSRVGADFSQSRGEIVDVSNEEAARMIAAEQAVPVGKTPVPAALRTGKKPEKAIKA